MGTAYGCGVGRSGDGDTEVEIERGQGMAGKRFGVKDFSGAGLSPEVPLAL